MPILVYPDVEQAIDFLCSTFGFTERLRAAFGGTVTHAQLSVREGSIMIGRQAGHYRAPQGDEVSAYVHIAVDNVDQHFERAQRAGARIIHGPIDQPFGERQYTVRDHAGHWWTFSQHIADVAPEQWGAVIKS